MTKLPPYEIPEADADLWECGVRLETTERQRVADSIVPLMAGDGEWWRYSPSAWLTLGDIADGLEADPGLVARELKRLSDRVVYNGKGYRLRSDGEVAAFRLARLESGSREPRSRWRDAVNCWTGRDYPGDELSEFRTKLNLVVVARHVGYAHGTSDGSSCAGKRGGWLPPIAVVQFDDDEPLDAPTAIERERIANAGEQAAIG